MFSISPTISSSITHLHLNSEWRGVVWQAVPGGCGQYFTSTSGTIQSFNYGGFYLAGVDYAICFRKEKVKVTIIHNTVKGEAEMVKRLMILPANYSFHCNFSPSSPSLITAGQVHYHTEGPGSFLRGLPKRPVPTACGSEGCHLHPLSPQPSLTLLSTQHTSRCPPAPRYDPGT